MLHNLCSVADHVLPFVPDEQTIKATTQFLTASKKEWDEEWKAWFVSLDPLKASASQVQNIVQWNNPLVMAMRGNKNQPPVKDQFKDSHPDGPPADPNGGVGTATVAVAVRAPNSARAWYYRQKLPLERIRRQSRSGATNVG